MAFQFEVSRNCGYVHELVFLVCIGKGQRPLRLEIFQESYL